MATINYAWLGITGAINFSPDTGLNDESEFFVDGDLTFSALVGELSEAKYLNRGNLPLARDYTQPVTPGQVITALGILGWNYTLDPDLQSGLENAENEDVGDAVN